MSARRRTAAVTAAALLLAGLAGSGCAPLEPSDTPADHLAETVKLAVEHLGYPVEDGHVECHGPDPSGHYHCYGVTTDEPTRSIDADFAPSPTGCTGTLTVELHVDPKGTDEPIATVTTDPCR